MQQAASFGSLEDWLWGTRTRQNELARRARIPASVLSELLSLQRGCTVFTALDLSRVTGVPVEKLVDWQKIRLKRTRRRVSKNRTRVSQ